MNTDAHRAQIRERRKAAAEKYKPTRIRLLLVAEAPPRDDDRYFYFEDVKEHDWLFRGVTEVLLGRKPARSEKAEALIKLKDLGVFLIDLKPDPMDGSDLASQVPGLVLRCRLLQPERIILIKAKVYDFAYSSLRAAGLPVVDKRVYFPGQGHQDEFRRQFTEALNLGVLND